MNQRSDDKKHLFEHPPARKRTLYRPVAVNECIEQGAAGRAPFASLRAGGCPQRESLCRAVVDALREEGRDGRRSS